MHMCTLGIPSNLCGAAAHVQDMCIDQVQHQNQYPLYCEYWKPNPLLRTSYPLNTLHILILKIIIKKHLWLVPSGCVITVSKSPHESFQSLNDPLQMMITAGKISCPTSEEEAPSLAPHDIESSTWYHQDILTELFVNLLMNPHILDHLVYDILSSITSG